MFYGWVVVAAAFTLMALGFGALYSFAAFFKAFEDEFAAPRAHVALVFALCAFLYFALGAAGGMLADRFGPRRVCLAGVAALALGLAAASQARSLPALYAAWALGFGLGIGLTYVPSVGAVQPWFVRRRGFASGLAIAGIGAGNLVVPPLAAWWIELWGWRAAQAALAFVALAAGLVAAALLSNDPARHGLAPDNDPRLHRAPQSRAQLPGAGLGEALAARAFRLHYAAMTLACIGVFVPMVHLAPYAQDAGHGAVAAVWLVSLIGAGSLLGRFLIGAAADRIGRERSVGLCYAALGALFFLWWGTSAYPVLAVFAFLFGLAYGGFVSLLPAVVMDHFGPRNVAGIIGMLFTGAGLGTLLGPPLAGAAFDATGSYDLPLLASGALSCIAGALVLFGAQPPRPGRDAAVAARAAPP